MFVLKLVQLYWVHLHFLQHLQNPYSKRAKKIFMFWVQFLVQNPACHKPTYIWKRQCLCGWVFMEKLYPLTLNLSNIDCNNFSESFIQSRLYLVRNGILSFSSAWDFFDTNFAPNFLTSPGAFPKHQYCVLNDLSSQLTKQMFHSN